MAGIDKTYTDSWAEYQSLLAWAKEQNCPGLEESIYEWEEEDFRNTAHPLPVLNTPERVDRYLALHCLLGFVQERLIEVYPRSWTRRYKNLDRRTRNKPRYINGRNR